MLSGIRGLTIKFANSQPCACRGSSVRVCNSWHLWLRSSIADVRAYKSSRGLYCVLCSVSFLLWAILPSGSLLCDVRREPDFSEEHIASILKVEEQPAETDGNLISLSLLPVSPPKRGALFKIHSATVRKTALTALRTSNPASVKCLLSSKLMFCYRNRSFNDATSITDKWTYNLLYVFNTCMDWMTGEQRLDFQ
jgi:hypothetical protein